MHPKGNNIRKHRPEVSRNDLKQYFETFTRQIKPITWPSLWNDNETGLGYPKKTYPRVGLTVTTLPRRRIDPSELIRLNRPIAIKMSQLNCFH
jgi:hypothetical protein